MANKPLTHDQNLNWRISFETVSTTLTSVTDGKKKNFGRNQNQNHLCLKLYSFKPTESFNFHHLSRIEKGPQNVKY